MSDCAIIDGIPSGAAVSRGFVRQIDQAMTELEVVNSIVETDIYNFTLPGGTLGANGALRLRITGDYLNNAFAAPTMTVAYRFGASISYQDASIAIGSNVNRRAVFMEFFMGNRDDQAAQTGGGYLGMSDAGGTTRGLGNWVNLATTATIGTTAVQFDATAIDTAVDQTLRVTVRHDTANANISFRRQMAFLDVAFRP